MADKVNKVTKSFSVFIIFLNTFGVSKFKPLQNFYLELGARFFTFAMMLLFVMLLYLNSINELLAVPDPVINYAQSIDRTTMILITAIIYLDATFRVKKNSSIFESLNEIDKLLFSNFGLTFNFVRIKFFNILIAIVSFYPFFLASRQFFIFDMNFQNASHYLIFVLALLIVYMIKSFYVLILLQFLIRVKNIETLLATKTDEFIAKRKNQLVEIFGMFFNLIDIFNESFGFIILMVVGEWD